MDAYEKFREKIDTSCPIPSPSTASKIELKILSRLMTPEDAEAGCHLSAMPESADAIAARAGVDVEKLRSALERLSDGGLIMKVYLDDPLYALVPMIPGIWEFQLGRLTPETAKEWEQYYYAGLGEAMFSLKTPFLRTVPIRKSLPAESSVLTYEEVERIIDNPYAVTLAPCMCRTNKKMLGGGCDAPTDTCLLLDSWADIYHHKGLGKKVTKDEAKSALRRAADAGLIHNTFNAQEGQVFICSCCGCCCEGLRAITELHLPHAVDSSNFVPEISAQDCVNCGECVDRCQVGALSDDGDTVTVSEERCLGCGVCASVCSSDAISLKRRAHQVTPVQTVTDLMVRLGSERA